MIFFFSFFLSVAANITTNSICIFAFDTYQWHPGKATTYILPVIEIEDIINRLTRIRNDLVSNDNNPIIEKLSGDQSTVVAQLNKQLDNWNTVLTNYRSHNLDIYSAFSQEKAIVQALMQTYQTWQTNIVGNGELQSFVTSELGANPVSIVQSVLSGSGSQAITTMQATTQSFQDLSTATSTLSDALSSLANPSSRMLTSSRSLQSASASTILLQLSDTFGTLASAASSVVDAFSSFISSSIVKEFVKVISTLVPSLQSKFDAALSKIQAKVKTLTAKILSFADAASSSLADFGAKVGDYLDDLQLALKVLSDIAPTVASVFNDIANAAQSLSSSVASALSNIASFFTTLSNIVTTLYQDVSVLANLFPSPTTLMLNSISTASANLSAISTTSAKLASAVTTINGEFPFPPSLQQALTEFANCKLLPPFRINCLLLWLK